MDNTEIEFGSEIKDLSTDGGHISVKAWKE